MDMVIRHRLSLCALVALLTAFTAAPAFAQDYGVGGGISQAPDQIFVQALADQRGLGTTGRIGWRPNVQIGFGNDQTLLSANAELVVWIPLPNPRWSTYVGTGPSLNILFQGGDNDGGGGNSEVGGGASLVAGVEHERGFFAELRVGGRSAAELKISAGILFKR